MVIGTPRREFSRGGRVEEREADFLMFGAAISASRNFEFARNDTKSTSDRGRNQSWRVIAISEPIRTDVSRRKISLTRRKRRMVAAACNGHED